MESMEAQKKPGIMARLRNRKGFSLVEMAIVLVIIGIIIGAIIKGQDLITNSRAKKVTSAVSTWRNLAMAYLDRNGRFPGDFGKDGVIGNSTGGVIEEQAALANTAIGEIQATMQNAPVNPITVGSTSFWVYFGNVMDGATTPAPRNAILLCKNVGCTGKFTADELEIIKTIDTSIDGIADGGFGVFRSISVAPTLTGGNAVSAAVLDDLTAPGTTKPWADTNFAAVYLFDRPI